MLAMDAVGLERLEVMVCHAEAPVVSSFPLYPCATRVWGGASCSPDFLSASCSFFPESGFCAAVSE
jgi:hypothetical protein